MEPYYIRVGIYEPYQLEVSIQHLSTHLDWMGVPKRNRVWECHREDWLGFHGWAITVKYERAQIYPEYIDSWPNDVVVYP